jgi:hypothetical protein
MKFAVLILLYDCDQFILRTIRNCAPHVDKIFVSYSPVPWNAYNTGSRDQYRNRSDPALLRQSEHFGKIELVQGEWASEHEQRNAVRERARDQGFDFLIVQDADEFYLPEEYQKNLREIAAHPEFAIYQNPWINFWRSLRYTIVLRGQGGEKHPVAYCALFALNLRLPVQFDRRRVPLAKVPIHRLSGVCYHLSYVLSDEDVTRKIHTWGHASEMSPHWHRFKWLAWTPRTRNLDPRFPASWLKAAPFTGPLPVELQDFPQPVQHGQPLSFPEKCRSLAYDFRDVLVFHLRNAWHALRRRRSRAR